MKASLVALAALVAAGCASTAPSRELVSARQAYDRARMGDAARYSPDTLMDARQALNAAERAHEDDAGSLNERSHAYVAQRKAELAMVHGTTARERESAAQAEEQYVQLLTESQTKLQASQDQVDSLSGQLERQTKASAEAEARARSAMESLAQVAQVKEEPRGTVITLSGQVLFTTGKSDLLPAARDRLGDIGKALVASGETRKIVIEGHTDARGSEGSNMALSRERAESVREYLISLGVKPEQISAVGKGEDQPVATNDTPDGRANNRRVEIVLEPMPGAAKAPAGQMPTTPTQPQTTPGQQPMPQPQKSPAQPAPGQTPKP